MNYLNRDHLSPSWDADLGRKVYYHRAKPLHLIRSPMKQLYGTYVGPRRELRRKTADCPVKGCFVYAQFDEVKDYDLGLPRWAFGRHRMPRRYFVLRVPIRWTLAARRSAARG